MAAVTFSDWWRGALLALWTFLLAPGAGADEHAELRAAVDRTTAQYQLALQVLETSGREQTTVEVEQLREAWHAVTDQFASSAPAPYANDDQYAATFMEIDARIVGALLVIGIGSREAARDALLSIGEMLAEFKKKSELELRPPSP